LSAPATCFQLSMTNDEFSATDGSGTAVASSEMVVALRSLVLGADCSECREILAGDFKGSYNLVDKYSSFCHSDTDMCVYANKDTQATVCFKMDAGGPDIMPHDETCA